MTSARALSRLLVVLLAAGQTLRRVRRRRPEKPKRVLIAHHLYLGDTLTVTPLLAKLREQYPDSDIVMTVPKAIAPLYKNRPYDITAVPYDPRDVVTLWRLVRISGFDLAFVPGDNRFSWLARALGARWVVAFEGDRPAYKSWPVDQCVRFPDSPQAWADIIASLAGDTAPPTYSLGAWPDPDCEPFVRPVTPYCVLHIGASTSLKYWPAERWSRLAAHLELTGSTVVWSGSIKDQRVVSEIDPESRYHSYAGKLALDQLWHLLKGAALLVTLDTGVAHLGRIVGTPTVTLFGPGSSILSGAGDFWRHSRFAAVTIPDFHCRDQKVLFKRTIPWMKRCVRSARECSNNLCMQAISLEMVKDAIGGLLGRSAPDEASSGKQNEEASKR